MELSAAALIGAAAQPTAANFRCTTRRCTTNCCQLLLPTSAAQPTPLHNAPPHNQLLH